MQGYSKNYASFPKEIITLNFTHHQVTLFPVAVIYKVYGEIIGDYFIILFDKLNHDDAVFWGQYRKTYGFHTLDYIPITHSYEFNNYCAQKLKSCKTLVAPAKPSIKSIRHGQDSNHRN